MKPRPPVRQRLRRWRPVLRPRPGRHLPSELQAGEVGCLAGALPQGVRDAGFETLLSRIAEKPFHSGNRVQLFFLGEDAFASMLEAVASARSEVLLESYILKDDPTGRLFQEALVAARRRGVAVRVLADGFGSWHTRSSFWRELRSNGIKARLFHPPWPGVRYLPFRDHRKIIVVDRRVAFTGGMNIADEYGSSRLPRGVLWRDTHARVEGPAAWEMAVVFREGWRQAGEPSFGIDDLIPVASSGAQILVLDSRPGRGAAEYAAALAAVVGAARTRLWLTTAYFAPRRRALTILGEAVRRGVDVRLLLPGRSDVPILRHAGHGFFSSLLRRGVRVFEYQPAMLHAKTAVADGYVSVVGSSNLDFRSFELNAECNFAILDAATGQRMEAQFEEDLASAVEIRPAPWRRRPWLHRSTDSLARRLAPVL